MATFEELGISANVLRAISDMGFEEATPIQEQTIPLAMQGKDLIGQAQTGTGKTAAFGIPMIQRIDINSPKIQSLVLTPTRELAIQVAEELNRLGQFQRIRTLPIYGGQDIMRQIRALSKHPHIIVGTPGRLMDHMRRKTIKLSDLSFLVLDEADEMLNMGFIEDIETIMQELPEERQNLLFSATMPKAIQALAQKFLRDPQIIRVQSKEVTMPSIEQEYVEVQERQKFDVLSRMLDMQSPELAIIFGRTKRRVDELTEALNKRGYSAEGLHGDLTQSKRDSVLRQFREGTIEVLVATDVAARGLDISGVTHVYNFDIPQDPESYVHRIGRTGRAGRSGLAITFVTPREIDHLRVIERVTKKRITRRSAPTLMEALAGVQQATLDQLIQVMEKGEYANYKSLAEELLEEHDSVNIMAAALKMLTKEPNSEPVYLTAEEPLRRRKPSSARPGGARSKAPYHKNNGRDGGYRRDRDFRDNRDRRHNSSSR